MKICVGGNNVSLCIWYISLCVLLVAAGRVRIWQREQSQPTRVSHVSQFHHKSLYGLHLILQGMYVSPTPLPLSLSPSSPCHPLFLCPSHSPFSPSPYFSPCPLLPLLSPYLFLSLPVPSPSPFCTSPFYLSSSHPSVSFLPLCTPSPPSTIVKHKILNVTCIITNCHMLQVHILDVT